MTITLSPEKKAFIQREIAAGGFKSESDAVERALEAYEEQLRRLRAAIDEADAAYANGDVATLSADEFMDIVRRNVPTHR